MDTIQLCRHLETAKGEKVQTLLNKNDPLSDCRSAIKSITDLGIKVGYSDGSLEEGLVGAGWQASGFGGSIISGHSYVGQRATVWDGKIRGIKKLIHGMRNEWDILILADSQAAIAVVKKAGKVGKARTKDLMDIIKSIHNRKGNTSFGWVKSQIGIEGNEQADVLAKKGTKWRNLSQKRVMTEGGVRQWVKQVR